MKAGFKPKTFTKKEWQDNRSSVAKGSGVGKALDAWQKDCPSKINSLDKAGVATAFKTAKALDAALTVAEKKCNPKQQKETIAGIKAYKDKVEEYMGLLKKAAIALDKRNKLISSLDFKTVVGDAELLKAFVIYAQKKAFIYEPLHTYLLIQKKKYEEAVKLYGNGGKGGGDYNTDQKTNKILHNTFVAKIREEQADVLKAIKQLEADMIQMLTDSRHYTAFAEYDAFLKILHSRFPIADFAL
jgi:hypothetical protein